MKKVFFIAIAAFVLASCTPSVSITSSWKNAEAVSATKSYKSVFISALTGNQSAKSTVENALAAAAEEKGYKVVKSIDLFTPDFGEKNNPDEATVIAKVKEAGCDAVFTVALINKESDTRYVPGSVSYAPYPARGYYGSYWGYNSYWSSSMYGTPGYYQTDKTYFLESNLYDVETQKILWSAQSQTVNPSSLKATSEKYTKAIVKKLEEDGLLKK